MVYTIGFLIAFIPVMLDYSVSEIVGNMVILFQVNALFMSIACFVLPAKYPEAWKRSTLHVPDPVFYGVNVLSTVAVLYAACVQIGALRPVILRVTFGGYALVIAYTQVRRRMGKVHIQDKIELE